MLDSQVICVSFTFWIRPRLTLLRVSVYLQGSGYELNFETQTPPSFPPDIEEFRSYLEKCFDFEQVTVKKFRTWAERRQFNRDLKRKQAESERPILPANQKLITLSVQDAPTKKGK